MRFTSTIEHRGTFPHFNDAVLREEISQARVPVAVAAAAGPAHRTFVEHLPAPWRADPSVEIFSRMLWLKPGWFPLGPHYHLDWYQPDGRQVETLMVLLGGTSCTEFVLGEFELEGVRTEPTQGEAGPRPTRGWAEQVAERVRTGELGTCALEPNVLTWFDNQTWHRARPAQYTGWRLLMRAIRGLPESERRRPAGRFTTARNGFLPQTPEEIERYAPYRG